MSANIIGGNRSKPRYFGLYLAGVVLGFLIRFVAFVVPSSIVARLERALLPGRK